MKIGVIGGGQMGAALVKGFLRAGIASAVEVTVVDTDAAARARMAEETGVGTSENVSKAARGAELLVLAVKPQVMGAALPGVGPHLEPTTTVLSIAAGVTTKRIEELLGVDSSPRVVRAMPNTPCLVGEGMSAICPGRFASAEDMDRAERALGAAGKVTRTDESKINAVTGVSGSGPAYVYTFINALADGGVKMGLPKAQALELAVQTVRGAALMVAETGEHPIVLRDRVTSPGGTTIAALHVLEEEAFAAAVISAVQAATERAEELA